jgi:hypothetical protein
LRWFYRKRFRNPQLLVEARREAVDNKTRYLNRLTSQPKMYFPQVLAWFSTPDTVVVGAVASRVACAGRTAASARPSSRIACWLRIAFWIRALQSCARLIQQAVPQSRTKP